MFFTMASVQFSACSSEDEANDESASLCSDTPTNTPTNDYMVIAQAVGGMQSCGIVMISKDGENVNDAVVKINNTPLPYDEYLGYAGYIDASTTGAEMELEITHNGIVIASGNSCVPGTPTITNIDEYPDVDNLQAFSDIINFSSNLKSPASINSKAIILVIILVIEAG